MTQTMMNAQQDKVTAIITRAWKDAGFKKQLLSDPRKILQKEAGIEVPEKGKMEILEETENKFFFVLPKKPAEGIKKEALAEIEKMKKEKNLTRNHYMAMLTIKCWQDDGFKKSLISDPHAAMTKEFGSKLPKDVSIKVIEAADNAFYFILPQKPSDELDDGQLENVAGGGMAADLGKSIGGTIDRLFSKEYWQTGGPINAVNQLFMAVTRKW